MTKAQIDILVRQGAFPGQTARPDLVETHISWVILCEQLVFKIKKPVHYSFLDFSTLQKRKYYCERELELNKRLTENIYLDVQPVREIATGFCIGDGNGEIADYAVRMRRVDGSRQMNLLLVDNKVTLADLQNLAKKIADFHKRADIIYRQDLPAIRDEFNDLAKEKDFLGKGLNTNRHKIICDAMAISDAFIQKHRALLASRRQAGFFRDVHGDLHSRNIFLLPDPQPFDCIEFNDDYRQIDVLNEIAFLCMDLEAFNRPDLADLFIRYYNLLFNAMKTPEDKQLFIYYKAYRANIRAKVNSLRARSADTKAEKERCLAETDKYLALMDRYMKMLVVQ